MRALPPHRPPPLSPDDPTDTLRPLDPERITSVAVALRGGLAAVLREHAGSPPRPYRLTQGLGLDKSLASRLVQAVRTESDLDLLHQVPSPTGLRILLDRAAPEAGDPLRRPLEAAIRAFEELLDSLPGGRQALDALMGESSGTIRERREQIARQAAFKSQSFLFGHFCETLTTALVLMPSQTPGRVDAIEVHRRIGLQRLLPSMTVPLLSVSTGPQPGGDTGPRLLPLDPAAAGTHIVDYLVPPVAPGLADRIDVVQDGPLTTFVFPPGEAAAIPTRLTTAWRIVRALPLAPEAPWQTLRNYMLHTPCRTLVRDLYLADGLWPDAMPQLDFYLPGPSGTPVVTVEPGQPHLRRLNLTARIEQLPQGALGLALEGVADQPEVLGRALADAGIEAASLRGWRCAMGYPLPLVEMLLSLRFAGR